MKLAYASRSRLWHSLLLSLVAIAGSACERAPDCKLYGACAGSLLKRADTFADTKKESCRTCLSDHCTAEEQRCSIDIPCNFTSRCMLTKSPLAYQECLRVLYEGGLTLGHEDRYPWEGRQGDAGGMRTFGECLHEHCRSACIADSFTCAKTFEEDEAYTEYDIRVEVAVRSYPDYKALPDVSLRVCEDRRNASVTSAFRTACEEGGTTDNHGVASLDVRRHIQADALYFEIEGQPGLFPKTLYYPGRLGSDGLQLLPIYIVKSSLIELGNEELQRGRTVLKDAAQSLILTDSCVWEKISAADLRVSVQEPYVPQCHQLDGGLCSGDAGCTPCIWYARKKHPYDGFPDINADRTDGTGAGIVGLDAGFYTIEVHDDAGVVGGRTVRMENGAMTIVRTWPPLERLPSPSAEP